MGFAPAGPVLWWASRRVESCRRAAAAAPCPSDRPCPLLMLTRLTLLSAPCRCEAVGAHWVQECPTQGDPNFDKKRVRPPVGIPMTRLARSEEGGLVLPGGQMGTLIANEDAFAREVLGLPTAAAPPGQQPQQAGDAAATQQQQQQQGGGEAKPPLLLLDSKPADETDAAAVKQEPGTAAAAAAAAAAPAPAVLPAVPASLPVLAGEAELGGMPLAGAMPGASFFSLIMHSALLPRGPPDFLRTAFDREEPLPRAGELGEEGVLGRG